ncbi:hypothetical protein [Microtetraspora fusca]|uniref:hypothetical protein n=1 Tax=Microtetraspora fusca TaxID=1997 RepID=UPI00083458B4|nr:hypothetical protein [Microtetraspora fusca]
MAGLDLHFKALERCRSALYEVARSFATPTGASESGGGGSTASGSGGGVGSSAFGRLSGSGGLAGAINEVEAALSSELGRVSGLLNANGNSLTTVGNNIRGVSRASEQDGERLARA